MLSDYYRERKGNGDFLVVHRHNGKNPNGTWPCRGCAIEGQEGSIQTTAASGRFLSSCVKADRRTIPSEWRRMLDGPDSGLSDSTVREAAQSLYAAVFADAWNEAGGRFAGGTEINDVCPPVPEQGVQVVRDWIAQIDDAIPYPLYDLFVALGDPDEDDHGSALYTLIMGCLGHGVGLGDWIDENADRDSESKAEEIIGGPIDKSPIHLDDWRLRELADDWVANHPVNVSHPTEIPS